MLTIGLLGGMSWASSAHYYRLVDTGAEGIVLGCTEIELLIEQADSPVPVFPTTRLRVEGPLDAAFAVPAARP
jgi:aspartate racemase